jgi:hypothetical protein
MNGAEPLHTNDAWATEGARAVQRGRRLGGRRLRDASADEIRRAYRRKIQRCHPDLIG